MHDALVIGGGYAGMAAALQLLRARRTVLVVDAGERRNRFSERSHGFLCQDGVDADEIAAAARRQLEAYPTLTWIEGTVARAGGSRDGFTAALASGEGHAARRVLLATGVADELPDVPGLAERWGRTVFQCPYCHGYELDRGRIGVIATGESSVKQAQLLAEWGEVTFFTNGACELEEADRRDLLGRGVAVEEAPVVGIEGAAEVVLGGGRRMSFAGIFTGTRSVPASPVAEEMGCALTENGTDVQVWRNGDKETSVPGVFACGDVACLPQSVALAVGDGACAGTEVHRSLVWPEG